MRARFILLLLLCISPTLGVERGENLLLAPGFESDGGWQPYGDGFEIDEGVAHEGARSIRCAGTTPESVTGASQIIELDPPINHPIRISGWSRAENASVEQDYSVYIDAFHDDGTPLWGQVATFDHGTHGWQWSSFVFTPTKPLARIECFLLFRRAHGTVWFDDITVELAPFEFSGTQIVTGLYGPASLEAVASTTLPAAWKAEVRAGDRLLQAAEGDATPVRFTWADQAPIVQGASLYVEATDNLLGQTISMQRAVGETQGGGQSDYVAWVENSMQRVMPQRLPMPPLPSPAASIALAGHEYESFQVVLRSRPGCTLDDVQVVCSDLVSPEGSTIASSNVEWQQVGYVMVEKPFNHPKVQDAAPGWWPDALLPVDTFDVQPSFSQPIWVTVYAPAGTPAGVYVGEIRIEPRGLAPTTVPVTVQVHPFALPVRGHLKTAFALMDGFLERPYGKPLTAELRQAYGDFLLRHRLNPDDISRTEAPVIEDLVHYQDTGLNAFNVLNMVQERGEGTWVCYSDKDVYTPEFKAALVERIDPHIKKLCAAGLLDRAYIYTFDERGLEFYPIIREYFGMVKTMWPEVHTLTTAYVPQDPILMDQLNIDWNCPLTARYSMEDADRCRLAGQQVWAYVCLGPRYPYANFLADDPLVEARVIWWQAFQQKMDGFLYWGLNIWDRPGSDTPIDPADGPLLDWSITTGGTYDSLHGDGRLLYAGVDGPIGSIRLANIRDGLEDYEYLWLLGDLASSRDFAREVAAGVTTDLTTFTRDPATVYRVRQRVADRIAKAQALACR